MNKQKIKAAVLDMLEASGEQLELPVPIKKIIRSFPNIKLVSYSRQMKEMNITYKEMLKFAETKDAFTDYYMRYDFYIIYYNDVNLDLITSNRYRWNIAHELGHIFLNHHQSSNNTRVFRSGLSDREYRFLENEADLFASYLLVPHIIVYLLSIKSNVELAHACRISNVAAKVRETNYKKWKKKNIYEAYDIEILNFFREYLNRCQVSQNAAEWLMQLSACRVCNGKILFPSAKFCINCGEVYSEIYRLEDYIMTLTEIELDENMHAIVCPNCGNDLIFKEGDFCIVCGNSVVNRCTSALSSEDPCDCQHIEPLPGRARYCPYCGSQTTFLKQNFLEPWCPYPVPEDISVSDETNFELPF